VWVLAEFLINLAIPKDVYGYFSTRGRDKYIGELYT